MVTYNAKTLIGVTNYLFMLLNTLKAEAEEQTRFFFSLKLGS